MSVLPVEPGGIVRPARPLGTGSHAGASLLDAGGCSGLASRLAESTVSRSALRGHSLLLTCTSTKSVDPTPIRSHAPNDAAARVTAYPAASNSSRERCSFRVPFALAFIAAPVSDDVAEPEILVRAQGVAHLRAPRGRLPGSRSASAPSDSSRSRPG